MPDDELTRALMQLQQARLSLIRRALAVEQHPASAGEALRMWNELAMGVGLLRLRWRLRRAEALLDARAAKGEPSVGSPA